MTYVIASACIDVKDRSCIAVCPVDCIYFEDTDRICYINPVECIDCAVCVSACPVQAIFAAEDVPADVREFIAVNELWFQDKNAARQKVLAFADNA